MSTPNDFKLKMPPEWFPHQRTLISWPVREALCWPENFHEVCGSYAEVAQAIARFEPVTMLVNPGMGEEAARLCGTTVEILEIEHNDAWMRDNGPTFIIDEKGQLAGVNWKFNAWGEKYYPWDLDNSVAPKVLQQLGIPHFDAPIILEGGSIHVDGEGTLITTEECLLNDNRNPHLNRAEIEDILRSYIGIEKVIWLKRGLAGDETDGHIDNVVSFARPGVILMQTCSDPEDPNFAITRENLDNLGNTTDARGRKLEIIEIPQPRATYYNEIRLTLSYLNFYYVNEGIILPVFGGEHLETDRAAEEILRLALPDRTIAKVDGMGLVKEGGNVHCITQQMPEGKPLKV